MTYYAYLNISNPWIAWLVYRGPIISASEISPAALSSWYAGHLRAVASNGGNPTPFYLKEQKIESIRASEFPATTSRLRCVYMFEDRETAEKVTAKWGGDFLPEYLSEIEMYPNCRITKCDTEWLGDGENIDPDSVRSYFKGESKGENPVWELLVEGRGFIPGTDLRKRAYDVIKEKWPNALATLEVSRIAADVGLDIGVSYPFFQMKDATLRIDWHINFPELDAESLAKMSKYKGPVNIKDWNGTNTFTMPDLRHESIVIHL